MCERRRMRPEAGNAPVRRPTAAAAGDQRRGCEQRDGARPLLVAERASLVASLRSRRGRWRRRSHGRSLVERSRRSIRVRWRCRLLRSWSRARAAYGRTVGNVSRAVPLLDASPTRTAEGRGGDTAPKPPEASLVTDAGAGDRGRRGDGRGGRVRAAPDGLGGRCRARRPSWAGAREGQRLRRDRARPRPAGDARRRAVRAARGGRMSQPRADADRGGDDGGRGRRACPGRRRLPAQAV